MLLLPDLECLSRYEGTGKEVCHAHQRRGSRGLGITVGDSREASIGSQEALEKYILVTAHEKVYTCDYEGNLRPHSIKEPPSAVPILAAMIYLLLRECIIRIQVS